MAYELVHGRVEGASFERGPVVFRPEHHFDERGDFAEVYNDREFRLWLAAETDLPAPATFVQDNESRSKPDVFRGLHYQVGAGQAKLVRVLRGVIVDFVLDVRAGSPTFGQWGYVRMPSVEDLLLYVPRGFAHGFWATQSESTVARVAYKVDQYWNPALERGVQMDDPALGLMEWIRRQDRRVFLRLSERDRSWPKLEDAEPYVG